MVISVRTFEGKTITLDAQVTDTVQSVKKEIQTKEGIRADLQRLMFANEQLKNGESLSNYGIREDSVLHLMLRSAENSKIVAGGYGQGSNTNQFSFPYGLVIDDDDQTIVVADWGNHRIVQWEIGETNGKVIAGGEEQGNQLNQLSGPTDVLIDRETNSVIICDRGNKRIVRWSRREGTTEGEVLLDSIACWGLALDEQRNLYVSDTEKHEVKSYRMGEKEGTIVAGGHGRGAGLHQLDEPSYVFVDRQQNVYVSDTWNYRVMKWNREAAVGIVVARGSPRGLFVDASENVYVADYGNRQLMQWPKGANKGTPYDGGHSEGDEQNQLYYPWSLAGDRQGRLYAADHFSQRVQRFSLE